MSEKEKSRDIISKRAVANRLSPAILNGGACVKRLAKSLAYIAIGYVTAATISHSIGIPYTIAFFLAVGTIVYINESGAKN
jgi:hypothetical protein